ncbi:DegV family protein [Ligilactobacillus animalis]|uniref:DegV family protein n=1 Tax=Ligilactobacillus animalis TaxID=1605 RepID=UPI001C110D00|nr:DegV family protein [Ligilactobacillus animalis]MBU5279158.1 DegV family protein [Ligilactobacillus animalis]
MKYKIIADSGSNVTTLADTDFTSVPITIMAGGKEYIDDAALDVLVMTDELRELSTKSSTACPNIDQWLTAFSEADIIVAVTITGALSGSYSAAVQAREQYLEEHPNAQVLILDSQSAGPRMQLLVEYAAKLFAAEAPFSEIESKLTTYQQHTGLLFSLESLTNLVNNGRISVAAAKISNMLKLRIVGTDTEGKLTPVGKARGQIKAINLLLKEMQAQGFNGKKACIAHCFNETGAESLSQKIKETYPACEVTVTTTRGVCSYYAEVGGLMVGFEKQ